MRFVSEIVGAIITAGGYAVQILSFIESSELANKLEIDRARLLCFYHYKETGETEFSMATVSMLMENAGFSRPNSSRLKERLVKGKGKAFLLSKSDKSKICFIPAVLQSLEKEFGSLWQDTTTIESNSELLEEAKFCGKRSFIDKLIRQINFSYGNNCYDACAVLMRRLFEMMLVLSYQNQGIEAEITNAQGNHLMLEGIVKNAVQNKTLGIPPRISKHFDQFRDAGNYSAHSITYTAGKKDIDDIKVDYRVMLEDLYNRAGLL